MLSNYTTYVKTCSPPHTYILGQQLSCHCFCILMNPLYVIVTEKLQHAHCVFLFNLFNFFFNFLTNLLLDLLPTVLHKSCILCQGQEKKNRTCITGHCEHMKNLHKYNKAEKVANIIAWSSLTTVALFRKMAGLKTFHILYLMLTVIALSVGTDTANSGPHKGNNKMAAYPELKKSFV
uniref:Uncharacterized protein n=1 Tax=Pyxicephalus adspersus TaxID=30357 RepID=A0AAV3B0K8_PYXAD|nr:TPA: hypothetical protein GDO54_008970 [Pyxicephalus adspersus]